MLSGSLQANPGIPREHGHGRALAVDLLSQVWVWPVALSDTTCDEIGREKLVGPPKAVDIEAVGFDFLTR